MTKDPSTRHRNIYHIRPNVTRLVSLMLEESCLEKIKRTLPIDIRLNPATLEFCATAPTFPSVNVTVTVVLLPFLTVTVVGRKADWDPCYFLSSRDRDKSTYHIIPGLDQLDKSTPRESLSKCADLIAHQGALVVVTRLVAIPRRFRDSREEAIVELAVEETIIGEAEGFYGGVKYVGKHVSWWWRVAALQSLAVAGDRHGGLGGAVVTW